MRQIDNVSDEATQKTKVVLESGKVVELTLTFMPAPQFWALDIVYGDFTAYGVRIAYHPNFLRSWRRILPFGIACVTLSGVDPFDQEDFANGNATLFLLDEAEVAAAEAGLFGAGA